MISGFETLENFEIQNIILKYYYYFIIIITTISIIMFITNHSYQILSKALYSSSYSS